MIKSNKILGEDTGNTLSIYCVDEIVITEDFFAMVRQFFSKETLSALAEYGLILRNIHERLITEGYKFINGTYIKNNE